MSISSGFLFTFTLGLCWVGGASGTRQRVGGVDDQRSVSTPAQGRELLRQVSSARRRSRFRQRPQTRLQRFDVYWTFWLSAAL